MKHFFLLASILLLLPFALAIDVGYIVKTGVGVDSNLISELQSNGFTVDIVYENELVFTDLNDYRFLVIGNQNLNNPGAIPIEEHRTIILNSYNYYQSGSDKQFGWSFDKGTKSSTVRTELKLESTPTPVLTI